MYIFPTILPILSNLKLSRKKCEEKYENRVIYFCRY